MTSSTPVVLFGPQATRISAIQAENICGALSSDPKRSFVLNAVSSFDGVVDAVKASHPRINTGSAKKQLECLATLLTTGRITDSVLLGSTFFAPLTIIQHIIEYTALARPSSPQGFCIGFLSAAAVSSSRNADDLERNFTIAINLAICVGCIVDAEPTSPSPDIQYARTYSVQWADTRGKTALEMLLKKFTTSYICCVTDIDRSSVTVGAEQEADFCRTARDLGVKLSPIGLTQAYHLQSRKNELAELKRLCSTDLRLKLPEVSSLQTPLRSNQNGNCIDIHSVGTLSSVALDSILVYPSQWYAVVSSALSSHQVEIPVVIQLGTSPSLPRSLSREANLKNAADLSDLHHEGILREQISLPFGPVAIIGASCRYPKANSLNDFWDLLAKGDCAVQEVPSHRFDLSQSKREPSGTFYGNFLQSPDAFDHRFFGISGREAKSMDPQQRLSLQVAYEAIESAGYSEVTANAGQNVGCYLGVGSVDYELNVASENATAFSATGTLRAFISGKISHYFGWTGPSITYDTACSSSAVAIHSACKALQLGECSMALAGGVNVMTAPPLYQNLAAASFLSKSGSSKAFDASADGYCRGEGCGIVLLKPLTRALADGDSVLGVIAGSGINQGSNCSPITVPHSDSQSALYKRVLNQGQVHPRDVSFVEAHGTGTPVGDPIEYESIRRAFGDARRDNELYIGSVKDNVGHAEGASGAAGLIKVLMMMHHRAIPKQANFKQLNPSIPLIEEDKLCVPTSTEPWNAPTRAALVNNYGAAGNNAAILVQQYAVKSKREALFDSHRVPFGLAAATESSLRKYAKVLLEYLRQHHHNSDTFDVMNIAWNLARRQNFGLEYKYNWISSGLSDLTKTLSELADGAVPLESRPLKTSRILCFGGQSGNTAFIAKEVYNSSVLLQKHLAHCEEALNQQNLPSIFPSIFDPSPEQDLVALHTRLCSIQYATAQTWIESGFKPSALVGHSFGQLTALCVAGAFSLDDCLSFITTRARLISQSWGNDKGLMLSVEATRSVVDKLLLETSSQGCLGDLEVACVNGTQRFIISGATASIEAFEEASKRHSSPPPRLRRLHNSHAYHSPLTEEILPGLLEAAQTIKFSPTTIHVETCTLDSSWYSASADRMVEHTRHPVYFQAAVDRLAKRFNDAVWLEAGTSSPVVPMIQRILKGTSSSHQFHPVDLTSGASANACLAEIVVNLKNAGSAVSFWPFHRTQSSCFEWIPLPPYQFEQSSHWIDYKPPMSTLSAKDEASHKESDELVSLIKSDEKTALYAINTEHDMFRLCVSGHAVLGQSLCPASMYLEIALRAAQLDLSRERASQPFKIEDLEIVSPLSLSPDGSLTVELGPESTNGQRSFKVATQISGKPTVHATGQLVVIIQETNQRRFASTSKLIGKSTCERIKNSSDAETLSGNIVYKVFGSVVDYAKYYRGVQSIIGKEHEAVAVVTRPGSLPQGLQRSISSPVMLDNFLQAAGIHVNCLTHCKPDEVYVCIGISELVFTSQYWEQAELERSWTVYSNFQTLSEGKITNDIYVLDDSTHTLVGMIQGAQFASVSLKRLASLLTKLNKSNTSVARGSDRNETNFAVEIGLKAYHKSPVPVQYMQMTPPDSAYESEAETRENEDADTDTDTLSQLQRLLCEILEIPVDELPVSSSLVELGVDSLMSTEVANEIKSVFGVDIDGTELIELATLDAVCSRISPVHGNLRATQLNRHASADQLKQPISVTESKALTPPETPRKAICRAAVDGMFDMKSHYDEITKETSLAGFNSEVYPKQAELVTAYLTQALQLFDCDLASMTAGTDVKVPIVKPQFEKPLNQYFAALAQAKVIEKTTNGWLRTSAAVPQESADVLLSRLLHRYPQHASEHKLLHTTASKLAGCLDGSEDPIGLIFRDATARELLQDVYTNAPMFKSGSIYLARYLNRVLNAAEPGRVVRILELGAGTGGTTSYLLSQLEPAGHKFEYMFTDLSPSLVAAAKKNFKRYDFMQYGVVDIEAAPSVDLIGQFDIVISTNCIHATRNLVNSGTNIRKVLREDGILCLVELTQNLYWFELVFGLLEGWWLFDDGRTHALASANFWNQSLTKAGFSWVDWTEGKSAESDIMRVIVASPWSKLSPTRPLMAEDTTSSVVETSKITLQESLTFKHVDGLALQADISYPKQAESSSHPPRPIALMIHGGGHIMLSRKDVRPQQTEHLLRSGFLPISIDYRLCPETTLLEGPMTDVRDAFVWIRESLDHVQRQRPDVKLDTSRVVVVGWSTGGHLAMTTAWTTRASHVPAPEAILAFYCPSDYEDGFWKRSNVPRGSEVAAAAALAQQQISLNELLKGTSDMPLVAYNPPIQNGVAPTGGWMAPTDARSRIALWMNWQGKHLHVVLNGLKKDSGDADNVDDIDASLPEPSIDAIQCASPKAQVEQGNYTTPTFMVHGTEDDLIPWQQTETTINALRATGVDADCRIVKGAAHLFDIERGWQKEPSQKTAVWDGYAFLRRHVGL